jgi:hypothetical protein
MLIPHRDTIIDRVWCSSLSRVFISERGARKYALPHALPTIPLAIHAPTTHPQKNYSSLHKH